MPLEIRELHIKVAIDEGAREAAPPTGNAEGQEAMIQAMIDKILEILKERLER